MTYPILITRFEAKALDFVDDLVQAGVAADDISICPVLRIDPIPAHIPDFEVAVFTSSQAVNALPDGFDPKGRLAFCVGHKTTQAAHERGFAAKCLGSTVNKMIDAWPDTAGPFVYFRGTHVTTDLVAALSDRANITDVIIYAQTPVPFSPAVLAFLERERCVVLPLFSVRSASLVLSQIETQQDHMAVCISEKVAAVCKDHGMKRVYVAARPDAAAMVDMTKHIAATGQV